MQALENPPRGRRVTLVAFAATGAFLLARLPPLLHREFDPDELEHAHAAWSLFRGMVPYKDFFEHHTPWYYYLLRPFFNWFPVDASFEAAKHFLIFGRVLSLGLTVLSLLLVMTIARLWRGSSGRPPRPLSPSPAAARAGTDDIPWVGPVAALLLVSQPVFLQKTLEMRPDVLALPFFLGALALLLRGMAPREDAGLLRMRWFVAGGACLGGAVMCTQKMLFVLPGLCLGLGLWALSHATRLRTRGRSALRPTLACLACAVGICLPVALTWAGFSAEGAGREFVTNNFLLNAHWRPAATNQGLRFVLTSAPMLALAALGVGAFVARLRASSPRDHGGVMLLGTLVGLFLGVAVVPVAQRQYYLMPLPITCLFAARGLFFLLARLPPRTRPAFLCVATVGLAVLPVFALRGAYREPNAPQLARLRQVFDGTAPGDLVMDGWQGLGVFRPHALYHFFLHAEVVSMLPPSRLQAYLDALERGTVQPRLIVLDKSLRALGPRFLQFVDARYASADGLLYFRK
jgi:hypothetical protein